MQSKGKFLAWLFLVLVWMPGVFVVYVFALMKLNLQGAMNFVPFLFFMYAIFVPLIVHSFWDEFAELFRKTGQDSK